MSSLQLHLVLFLVVHLRAGWSMRTWQSDLSFNNPHNWSPGRVPCPADRMVLRTSDPLVLQMPQGQTSVRGIVLPDYLELVLPENGAVELTGIEHSSSCDGQDAVFKRTQALRWTDPDNWDGWNKASPDLERLPCSWDYVRFPPGITVNAITPPVLRLGTLEINGVAMDSFDWNEQSSSGDSSWLLHQPDGDVPSVELSTTTCSSQHWCQCGNEYLHSELCKSACPLALCKQPVKPSGFCCPICGAYFMLRSKNEEKLQLTTVINSFLKGRGIAWHGSKVGQLVQIVLMEEEEYSGELLTIANNLKVFIEKSGEDWHVEQVHVSGHIWYPISAFQVVTHFFSLFVFALLSAGAIIVFYSNKWSWLQFLSSQGRPFVFARFENQSGDLLVAHEHRASSPSPLQTFDNPMYGATGKVEQRNMTVENLICTELEDSSECCSAEEPVILNSPDFPMY